jgi:hypothetical protein
MPPDITQQPMLRRMIQQIRFLRQSIELFPIVGLLLLFVCVILGMFIPGLHLAIIKLYVVCLKSSVNGTRKQTKQKIQTN